MTHFPLEPRRNGVGEEGLPRRARNKSQQATRRGSVKTEGLPKREHRRKGSWSSRISAHLASYWLASSPVFLPPEVAPSTQSSFQRWHPVVPHYSSEKTPNPLAQYSGHFRTCPPDRFILDSSWELPQHSNPPGFHTLHVLFQPPELSTCLGWLSASYSVFKIQFKCHLLYKSLTSPKSMSHSFLWGPSLHQNTPLTVLSVTFWATPRPGPRVSQ